MKSSVTNAFRKKLDQLPASVQEQAAKAYALWHSDPYHNSLQFKRVSQRQPIYSVRVGLNYRVLGLL
jgi:mRNA-degrading endonuclease RelE of RelBE toxin-antitoxin system